MNLDALTRFEKSDRDFRLTKIASKREGFVGVGQFEEGEFSLFEFPVTDKHPEVATGVIIRGHSFTSSYLRTSPIVKIVDQSETTTTFETEGGVYRLEQL